jgi:ribonuclease D
VRQLIRLRDALRGELEECGRLEWGREEFEVVAARKREPRGFDRNGFWNLKGARDLEPAQTAVLRELYVMRDERARAADLPPFRILSDDALMALARRSPRSAAETEGIKGFTPLVRRRIGEQVLVAVAKGLTIPEANRPKPPRTPGRRRSAAFRVRLERLRAWRKAKSGALGLDPGVLFPQLTLEALAASGLAGLEKPEQIQGLREWRRKLIQPEAATLLA